MILGKGYMWFISSIILYGDLGDTQITIDDKIWYIIVYDKQYTLYGLSMLIPSIYANHLF